MWFEFEKIIWDTFDDINNINSDIGDRNDNVYWLACSFQKAQKCR